MQQRVALDMIASGLSDVGRVRKRNEDAFGILTEVGLAVVCDGMGGHAGGDIASRTASDAIADFVYEFEPPTGKKADPDSTDGDQTVGGPTVAEPAVQEAVGIIRSAVQLANRKLAALNQERGFADGRGMGTTVVGLWRVEGTDKVVVFHAGDSRLYRLRRGELTQLTRDHSLYQIWLDNGGHGQPPQKNIIVRALGTAAEVEPDIAIHALQPDDRFLLCSDGLTGMIDDAVIARELVRARDGGFEPTCARLIDMANAQGGHDNVTVVLVRFKPAG